MTGPDQGVPARGHGRVVLIEGKLGVLLHHVPRDVREGERLPSRDVLHVVVVLDVLRGGFPDGLLLEVQKKRLKIVGVHVHELVRRVVGKRGDTVLLFLLFLGLFWFFLLVPEPAPLGILIVGDRIEFGNKDRPEGVRRDKDATEEDGQSLQRSSFRQNPGISNRSCRRGGP